jgi:hypothetical protein
MIPQKIFRMDIDFGGLHRAKTGRKRDKSSEERRVREKKRKKNRQMEENFPINSTSRLFFIP